MTEELDEERRYIYSLELACLLCGRVVGEAESDTPLPTTRTFVPASTRCGHCGGPPTFSGEVGRQIASKVQFEALRRGRPSKALVEARRAGLEYQAISHWQKSMAVAS